MGVHTVFEDEAKERLSDLIDRALDGEDIRISRGGRSVVLLRAALDQSLPSVRSDRLARLRQHRVNVGDAAFDSVAMLRSMRDGSD